MKKIMNIILTLILTFSLWGCKKTSLEDTTVKVIDFWLEEHQKAFDIKSIYYAKVEGVTIYNDYEQKDIGDCIVAILNGDSGELTGLQVYLIFDESVNDNADVLQPETIIYSQDGNIMYIDNWMINTNNGQIVEVDDLPDAKQLEVSKVSK